MKLTLLYWTILIGTTYSLRRGSPTGRIIGGQDVDVNGFRFVVGINVQTTTSKFFCSGTLIHEFWLVTSGTCVDGGVLFTVTIGAESLDDPDAIILTTSDYAVHPDFNATTLNSDIGLIRFLLPLDYSWGISFLHPFFIPPEAGSSVFAIGWGHTGDNETDLSNYLKYVNLRVISGDECRSYYGNQITDHMTCVQGDTNEGICLGDQGGPLFSTDAFWIHGIASFLSGKGCDTNEPSGYTTVAPFMNWISFYTD